MILIIVLLLSNIYLAYNLNKANNEIKILKHGMLARADRAIDDAVNSISTLNYEWEEKSDTEKMRYLGKVDSNLVLAMELMSGADSFFLPVKIYRDGVYVLEEKIINDIDENTQKEYIEGLDNDFTILWKFLSNFIFSDMTKEEAREKWKDEIKHLKTEEIKH